MFNTFAYWVVESRAAVNEVLRLSENPAGNCCWSCHVCTRTMCQVWHVSTRQLAVNSSALKAFEQSTACQSIDTVLLLYADRNSKAAGGQQTLYLGVVWCLGFRVITTSTMPCNRFRVLSMGVSASNPDGLCWNLSCKTTSRR